MPSISTRTPKLACAAVFAALCLIGWVAKSLWPKIQPRNRLRPAARAARAQRAAASPIPQGFDVPKVDTASCQSRPTIVCSPPPATPGIAAAADRIRRARPLPDNQRRAGHARARSHGTPRRRPGEGRPALR